MDLRQFSAAVARSSALRGTWTSFSASTKVAVETGGPASAAVPKAGGIPAGALLVPGCFDSLLQAAVMAARTAVTPFRKLRRELSMLTPRIPLHLTLRCDAMKG